MTVSQRGKEEAHDYRYFPEPDLPPLVVEKEWVRRIWADLPELPQAKLRRFTYTYGLNAYDSNLLVVEPEVAEYFDQAVEAGSGIAPKTIANWITGELFGLANQHNAGIDRVSPRALVELIGSVAQGEINQTTAKAVLSEMFASGKTSAAIIRERGLSQLSDTAQIADLVRKVLAENPNQVASYQTGKESVSTWLFGQVMRAARGQANPQVVRAELEKQLKA